MVNSERIMLDDLSACVRAVGSWEQAAMIAGIILGPFVSIIAKQYLEISRLNKDLFNSAKENTEAWSKLTTALIARGGGDRL